MIETLEGAAKALLRHRSAQAVQDFRRSVRPIYGVAGSGPNPVLKHAGSIDGHRVLSTAAHILDEISAGVPLAVGGPVGTRPVPIVGGVLRTTTAPHGDRHLDHLDCGFWKIPEEMVRALEHYEEHRAMVAVKIGAILNGIRRSRRRS